jgi:hypothetical protein
MSTEDDIVENGEGKKKINDIDSIARRTAEARLILDQKRK